MIQNIVERPFIVIEITRISNPTMTHLDHQITGIHFDTATDFRTCYVGKRSAKITLTFATGATYCLDNHRAPTEQGLWLFADSEKASHIFGDYGRIANDGGHLTLHITIEETGEEISLFLGCNTINLAYMVELARLVSWCNESDPKDRESYNPYLPRANPDLQISVCHMVLSNRVLVAPAPVASEQIIEKTSDALEQTIEQKIVNAALIFQEKRMLVESYQALLDQIDENNRNRLLDHALVFAHDFCSQEAEDDLLSLREEYRSLRKRIAQKVQCLILELA